MSRDHNEVLRGQLRAALNRAATGSARSPDSARPSFELASGASLEASQGHSGGNDKPGLKLDREPPIHLKKAGAEYDATSSTMSQRSKGPEFSR